MELVLEILSRSGKVTSFFKLVNQHTDIGRAYNNDIVLQDQYICPNHLSLSVVDGQVWVTDKQSINGVKTEQNQPISEPTSFELGQPFLVGNMLMRVIDSQQTLAETVRITLLEYISQRFNHWYWALSLIFLVIGLSVLNRYLGQSTEIIWSKLMVKDLPSVLILFSIGTFVAGMANLFKKEVRFFTCIGYIFIWEIARVQLLKLNGFLSFNFGQNIVLMLTEKLITFGLAISALWALFYFTTHFSYKKISVISAALVFSGQGLFIGYQLADDKVKSYPSHMVHIFPQAYLINSDDDYQVWVEGTSNLYEASSKEAKRRNDKADKMRTEQ